MNWTAVGENAVGASAVVATILATLTPVLLPLLLGVVKDRRHAQAFAAVSRAGLLAINAAAQAMRSAILDAKKDDSPGGSAYTPEEKKRVLSIGISTGMNWLRDSNVLDQVIAAYGGEDAVKLALEEIIRSKMSGV